MATAHLLLDHILRERKGRKMRVGKVWPVTLQKKGTLYMPTGVSSPRDRTLQCLLVRLKPKHQKEAFRQR